MSDRDIPLRRGMYQHDTKVLHGVVRRSVAELGLAFCQVNDTRSVRGQTLGRAGLRYGHGNANCGATDTQQEFQNEELDSCQPRL